MLLLDAAAILVTATMVGSEFGVAALVHPALTRLPDRDHLRAARALARLLGRVMPFWYAGALLFLLAEAILRRDWLVCAAAAIWAAVIVYTLIAPVPVNTRIANWTAGPESLEWKTYRAQWDRRHRARVALLGLSLALLLFDLLRR